MESKTVRAWNFKVFVASNSIGFFASGLLGPFFVLFVQHIGGSIENLGYATGILLLVQSITSYFVGKHSDKIGRKPFLIANGYFSSILLVLYTFVSSLYQLFILQIISGISNALWVTTEKSFLGDITRKSTRGADIGKYTAIVGIFAAIAIMLGGILVGKFGFSLIFYIAAAVVAFSTSMLFWIKE